MRQQSRHRRADHPLDAYFTPPEATRSLVHVEGAHIPHRIWEPAAGDGSIAKALVAAGFDVVATDIADYGWDGCRSEVDYLHAEPPAGVEGVITNPPFRLAEAFARKALAEVDYLALLLRTNFLEAQGRLPFWRQYMPARIWVSSSRLPMMHRNGWNGKKSTSNICHAWFVWDRRSEAIRGLGHFDWREICNKIPTSSRKQGGAASPPNSTSTCFID
jgi:hypothetical protein